MNEGRRARDGRRDSVVWGATALFAALGAWFATVQNVWVDESTQLLGSRLPIGRMMEWLGGQGGTIGVPYDRMPPLSYLVDAACWSTLCATDMHLRLLHLAIATAGVFVLMRLVVSRMGLWAGMVAGALLVFAPQMIEVAVEIRAYPLLFALSAAAVALIWQIFEAPTVTWRGILPFWIVSVVAAYTHFFGLVMAGAYFTALLVVKARRRREVIVIVAAGIALLFASFGLLPFVAGAKAASGVAGGDPAGLLPRVVQYGLRLLAGPETVILMPLAGLYFAALGALAVIALRRIAAGVGSTIVAPVAGIAVALAAGVAVTVAAAALSHVFDPLKTTYSIWMWPAIVVLIASACGPEPVRLWRRAARGAAGLLIATTGCVTLLFASHATWFVHGPEQSITAAITAPAQTAIVYDGNMWAFGFFPVVYRFGTSFPQYVRMRDGTVHRILTGGGIAPVPVSSAMLDRYPHIIVAAIDLATYRDLRRYLSGGSRPAAPLDTPVPARIATERRAVSGLYGIQLARYDKDLR